MTPRIRQWIPAAIALIVSMSARAADVLCDPLADFVRSVAVGESREIRFHAIVGGNFKGREQPAYGARRCEYAGYEPGKPLCKYFMDYGSIESPGYNVKAVISCLSPKTRFAAGTWLYGVSFAVNVGSETRGSRVEVVLADDKELGGMSISIKTTGY
jgi:hypothetical protein